MANDSKTWRCGKYELSFDRPRIMGVLNVTPDSFSDGGEHFDPDAAIEYGLAMLDAGADIIDVGGESTRPGFTPVNPDEEARRVLPVVRALAKEGAIVSIDTRHVAVAKAAVRCGASIVNDVTGFTDPKMVEFVKTSTCGVIVMHAGEVAAPTRTHATVQLDTSAAAFVAEKAREAAAEAAREAEKPARRRRGKLLGEPKPEAKLPGGVVQPSLPFGDPEPATEPASEQETPAAEQAAAAETVAPAPEATEAASEPNDRLAAMMRRSARREEAYVPTSQLRRFTLPDSAPIMRRVMGFLSDQARALIHAGVSRDRICIDPGPGFGKTANEDIVIQRETAKMASLGYPLMCAVSRKRFVGAVSGVTEAAERDAATFGVCLGAIQAGANIVRVHDAAGFAQFLNGYWAVAKPQPRRAFVAVGSNLGHRCDNIRAARDMIAEIPLTCVSNSSKIYESEPAYYLDQDSFVNAVVLLRTGIPPKELLGYLHAVENSLGRVREVRNGPRTCDLDILDYQLYVVDADVLTLPHPRLLERDFVVQPLLELLPGHVLANDVPVSVDGVTWGRACGCEQGALCALVLRRRLFVAPERRCACFGIWIRQRGGRRFAERLPVSHRSARGSCIDERRSQARVGGGRAGRPRRPRASPGFRLRPAGSFVDQPGRRTVLLAVVAPPGGAARTSHVEPGCGHGGAPRTRCAGGRAG